MINWDLAKSYGVTQGIRNGKKVLIFPSGISRERKNQVLGLGTPRIIGHSLANPPIRPKVVRQKEYYHMRTLTACSSAEFFAALPSSKPLDGNFSQTGIAKKMEILGLRLKYTPQVVVDQGSAYVTNYNQILDGVWELKINDNVAVSGMIADIAPDLSVCESGTGNQFIFNVLKTDFYFFLMEGMKDDIDKLVVEEGDEVIVKLYFTASTTTSPTGGKLGIGLLSRPVIKALVG